MRPGPRQQWRVLELLPHPMQGTVAAVMGPSVPMCVYGAWPKLRGREGGLTGTALSAA